MAERSDEEIADEQLDRVLGALFRRLTKSSAIAMPAPEARDSRPHCSVEALSGNRCHGTPEHIIEEISLRLADLLEERIRPVLPLSVALWDIATIAVYLQRDPDSVRERIACLPDFPMPIRLPSTTKRGAHPLYKAAEVISWAEGYQRKPPSTGKRRAQIARGV